MEIENIIKCNKVNNEAMNAKPAYNWFSNCVAHKDIEDQLPIFKIQRSTLGIIFSYILYQNKE